MTTAVAIAAAIVVAILVFFPAIRRVVRIVVTILITLCTSAIAIGGLLILMNNVSISDQPGILPRIYRFLTVDWAATSAKGIGSASCKDAAAIESSSTEAPAASQRQRRADHSVHAGQPTASPSPGANPEEDVYPELVRRGYPGLSRAKLFAMAKETVGELGGWKVVKEEPRAYTLECTYTSRVLNLEDQIRIVVTPRSEIDLCSHSGVADSNGRAWDWLFSGDFAANIGHIKEFYMALEPRIDQAYKEQERKQGDAG